MLRIGRPARGEAWLAVWMRRTAAGLSAPPANLQVWLAVGLRAGLGEGKGLCERLRWVTCETELGAKRARPPL